MMYMPSNRIRNKAMKNLLNSEVCAFCVAIRFSDQFVEMYSNTKCMRMCRNDKLRGEMGLIANACCFQ